MDRLQVAIVCPADEARMTVAKAFDRAPPGWDVRLHREMPTEADVVVSAGVNVHGAIVFDPAEPHRVIADIQRWIERLSRRVFVVTGASGGSGATTLALHLAASGPQPTCLVELSDRPQVAVRLGLVATPEPPAEDVAPVPVPGGFKLISLAPGVPVAILERALAASPRVVIDVAPDALSGVVRRCDAGVLVMQPTVTSATGAIRVLDEHRDLPWALVSNRVGPGGETSRAELQRAVGRRVTMELPCSRAVRDAESDKRLVTAPWSRWRAKVLRLAGALEE